MSDLTTGCVFLFHYKRVVQVCTSICLCISVVRDYFYPSIGLRSLFLFHLDRRPWKATLTGWHDRSKCLYEIHRRLDIANELQLSKTWTSFTKLCRLTCNAFVALGHLVMITSTSSSNGNIFFTLFFFFSFLVFFLCKERRGNNFTLTLFLLSCYCCAFTSIDVCVLFFFCLFFPFFSNSSAPSNWVRSSFLTFTVKQVRCWI